MPNRLADRANALARKLPAWLIYAGTAAWAGWMFWQGVAGALGPDPVAALERAYGDAALKLLAATLAITPLRRLLGLNLLKFRRALGLSCFFVVVAHLSVWALLDLQSAARVWADIVKRPYITVGMAAFALMVPLALTSNDRALRRLGGAAWRRLHRLSYLLVPLALLHFLWLTRGFPTRPLAFAALFAALFAARIGWRRLLRRTAPAGRDSPAAR